jgi:hypothetical protein
VHAAEVRPATDPYLPAGQGVPVPLVAPASQ